MTGHIWRHDIRHSCENVSECRNLANYAECHVTSHLIPVLKHFTNNVLSVFEIIKHSKYYLNSYFNKFSS